MPARRILSRRPTAILSVLTALTVLSACGDSTGPDDDHHEPAGLRASLSGAVAVSVNAARQVTGSFTVAAGLSSGPISVVFLDEEGDPIAPDEDEYLRVEIDGTIATSTQNPGGAFTFTLNGLTAGTTTMRLSLMHGSFPGGHPDYVSPNITVVVAPIG